MSRPLRRALLVDDSPTFQVVLSAELEGVGWRCLCVSDAREALTVLNLDPAFDLVVTDFDMPDLDGVELIRQIRRQPRLAAVAAVVVTGVPTDDVRGSAYAAGAAAVIRKSAVFEELPELLLAAGEV